MTLNPNPYVLVLTFIPAGWSEPEERRYYPEPFEDLDWAVDKLVNEAWDRGDEPLDVSLISPEGWPKSLYNNPRY